MPRRRHVQQLHVRYDEIIAPTETYRVGEHDLKVICLDDLNAIKQFHDEAE